MKPPSSTIKSRKVYTLRKNVNSRIVASSNIDKNANSGVIYAPINQKQSRAIKNNDLANSVTIESPRTQTLVNGPQLIFDKLYLQFETELNNLQVKYLKVKNVGISAIYYQWVCKNLSKINPNAIKDPKPKFYCHYQHNAIQPGQEIIFSFSFLSRIPGYFIQEYAFQCKPQLLTPIPSIKLQGKAYITDENQKQRIQLIKSIKQDSIAATAREILEDVIKQVKSPQPPRPDVSNPEIAQRQFQAKNASKGLYYIPMVHNWFKQLHQQICKKINPNNQDIYWDQSVESISKLINAANFQEVQEKWYQERLQHYYHLSAFPPANKSQLFPKIREFIINAGFKVGGDFSDAVKKQLDMWQIPFKEPKPEDTQEDNKARQQQIAKIKQQWLKRTKKKKWTDDDEKDLVKQYKSKLQARVTQDILSNFTGFENQAQYIKVQSLIQKQFNVDKYTDFLSRLKTVKETPLEGKKVMIKFNLKLKENSQEKLKQLAEYITKKQEEHRLQEQRKNQEQNSKKKKQPAQSKKKKGQKQEQQKPLFFDFMSLLDQQNWNAFVQTYKIIQEKQPILTIIACSYGPRIGRYVEKYSIKFLMQHIKSVDPIIQFMNHQEFVEIRNKIEDQTLNEGAVYLIENINFLPYQVMQQEIVTVQNEQEKITSRKLIYPEINTQLKEISTIIDVIVTEDRYSNEASGLMSYFHKQNILGLKWWNYIGLSIRAACENSQLILGGRLTPQNLLFLGRGLKWFTFISLVGQIGLKFSLVKLWSKDNKLQLIDQNWYGVKITKTQKNAINNFLKMLKQQNIQNKLILPTDCYFVKKQQVQEEGEGQLQKKDAKYQIIEYKLKNEEGKQQPDKEAYIVIDIGNDTIGVLQESLKAPGYLFILDKPIINTSLPHQFISSFSKLCKHLLNCQQQKKQRHKQQQNTGINYALDSVYMVFGIKKEQVEAISFKEQKKILEGNEEEEVQQQEQPQQQQGSKIDRISDFHLDSISCVKKIIIGNFNVGLRDIERYPKSD